MSILLLYNHIIKLHIYILYNYMYYDVCVYVCVSVCVCMNKYCLPLMPSLLEVAHLQHLWRQRRQHHALLVLPRRHKVINVPIFCHL